ncbi:MAG: divalent metal cation transporter [Chitinispirillaceae bacterium]|nr:divalent metal cation transporter [Chitinispirillaceae bacterium]
MSNNKINFNPKHLLKIIGPGQLFASIAIGTSHLVLSTRAGAYYGMIFFWIILIIQVLKYPFFEFGARYTSATGQTMLKGLLDRGKWAVILFMLVILIDMFAVTGAVGAVCAGLLSTMFGMASVPMPLLLGAVFFITAALLLIGRYSVLNTFIKFISVVLLITVLTAFISVLLKGPVEATVPLPPSADLLKGAGLALLVSLIGFMPTGFEVAVMHSIWTVENMKATGYRPTLREALFDFNLGYVFTTILALMFMTIGAFTIYGTGLRLPGDSAKFSNQLLHIFTSNIGAWTHPFIALAAFGTIYGTFITVWDAFTRSFVRGVQVLKFNNSRDDRAQQRFLNRFYNILLPIIGLGSFLLCIRFAQGMIKLLELSTITVFLTAPVLALLYLVVISSKTIPASHRPSKGLFLLAYVGLAAMIVFTLYYLWDLLPPG